jgi:glycosyltransferase involved in cell wall biosynthesis
MKVSICSITYNHEKYISQAIESWLQQETNFEFEIVIGEDGSKDNTRAIISKYIEQYAERIKMISSQENVGMLGNFLRTIEACNGDFIAICEGDDYWIDNKKLQKQIDFLESNSDYGMISGDIVLVDENDNPIEDNQMVLEQRAKRKETISFIDLLQTNIINTLTVCVRADLMKELVQRIRKENFWLVLDYWFWLSISINHKISVSTEKLAKYRVHNQGATKNSNDIKKRIANARFDGIKKYLIVNNNISSNHKRVLLKTLVGLFKQKELCRSFRAKILLFLISHLDLFISFKSKG